jgi:hypothetical protein
MSPELSRNVTLACTMHVNETRASRMHTATVPSRIGGHIWGYEWTLDSDGIHHPVHRPWVDGWPGSGPYRLNGVPVDHAPAGVRSDLEHQLPSGEWGAPVDASGT